MLRLLIAMAIALATTTAGLACHGAALYRQKDCSKFDVQMELNQCAEENFEAADKALNEAYRKVMSRMAHDVAKDRLRHEERAWVAYRDKSCNDEVGPREGGGSIWPLDMATCLQKKTDARIHVLAHLAH